MKKKKQPSVDLLQGDDEFVKKKQSRVETGSLRTVGVPGQCQVLGILTMHVSRLFLSTFSIAGVAIQHLVSNELCSGKKPEERLSGLPQQF